MCFEDVVAQLDGLLPVQLALLPGEPEGQQRVAAPAERERTPRFESDSPGRYITTGPVGAKRSD